ncbi:sigma-54-dependent Fis family transcriptional regulator [Celeribacter halophilus]|uniref:sigma-54-dependent Fis family transcriptional regulator n=1 Tax=Celeribacter halophilus TaxID=576117 RepID=UPI0026E42A35|nr:sigma-54-dependent Fis family transcriptional regulator [Celeribacter halophilus]MDO6724518.1 sigma-54-dependent Fis family transcriptional regulator [Celeribacter halophilus]
MADLTSHAAHVSKVITTKDISRLPLAASWHRCAHLHGLDPEATLQPQRITDTELRRLSEPLEPLLAAAAPTLERLRCAIGNRGVCMLVSNAQGVPVLCWGPEADMPDLQKRGLCEGVDWSEAQSGTNGIGTSLVERRALCVRPHQHYYATTLRITCVSAPFFDDQGTLAGAANITYYGRASEQAPVGLLMSSISNATRQIEIDHFHQTFAGDRIISIPGETRSGAILLAVDRDDVITGATRGARRVFGLTDTDLNAGIIASDLFAKFLEPLDDTLQTAEYSVLRRWLIRNGGNVTASARDLQISHATLKRKLKAHSLNRRRLN